MIEIKIKGGLIIKVPVKNIGSQTNIQPGCIAFKILSGVFHRIEISENQTTEYF